MKECKLHNVHRKFNEAFVLWEQAYENYFNPERFVANINAVIQAIRNITFSLQAEKNNIKNFDEWYKTWQERMRDDEALVWIKDSRNKIVKQKDFEINSHSIVRIYDYDTVYLARLKVPICMPTPAIIGYLLTEKQIHPQMIRSEMILEIERTWIVPTYPTCDILVVLLYCFPFFHNLIMDAHSQAEIDINTCNYVEVERQSKRHQKIIDLIENIRKPMKQKMSLADLAPIEIKTTLGRKPTEESDIKIKERYGVDKKTLKETKSQDELESFIHIAKLIVSKDGYHQPVAFLFDSAGVPKQIALNYESRAGKYLAVEKIAEIVKAEDIIKVILINESYYFCANENPSFLKDMDIDAVKNKKDSLMFDLLIKGQKPINRTILFERNTQGEMVFQEVDISGGEFSYTKPILKVWEEETK